MKDAYTPEEDVKLLQERIWQRAYLDTPEQVQKQIIDFCEAYSESKFAALTAEVAQLRESYDKLYNEDQGVRVRLNTVSNDIETIRRDRDIISNDFFRVRDELARVKAERDELMKDGERKSELLRAVDDDSMVGAIAKRAIENALRATVTSQAATIEELRKALLDIYSTLNSDDTMLCQILPEKDSFYKPDLWLTMARAALSRSAKPTGE